MFCCIIRCSVFKYIQMFLPVVNTYKDITHLLTLYLTLSPVWSIFRENLFVQDILLAENIISHVHITPHQSITELVIYIYLVTCLSAM